MAQEYQPTEKDLEDAKQALIKSGEQGKTLQQAMCEFAFDHIVTYSKDMHEWLKNVEQSDAYLQGVSISEIFESEMTRYLNY